MKKPAFARTINNLRNVMPQVAALLCCLCAVSPASAAWNKSATLPPMEQIKSTTEDSAKRASPEAIQPVVIGDVEFVVIHFPLKGSNIQNGGYIEARDKSSGKKLWGIQVYTTKYDKSREQDVQDVFITEVTFDEKRGVLLVTDEQDRRYMVDIETQQVAQLPTKRNKSNTDDKK